MAAYMQMGRRLWGQHHLGEGHDTPALVKCRKTKQKVSSDVSLNGNCQRIK